VKVKIFLTAIFTFGLLNSCISHERAKQLFVYERNYDIGRVVTVVPLPKPTKILPIDKESSLYIYEFKNTGCQWSYVVDDSTKIILSWKFISDPDLCYLKLRGGG